MHPPPTPAATGIPCPRASNRAVHVAQLVALAFFFAAACVSAQTAADRLLGSARGGGQPRVGTTAEGAVRFVSAGAGGHFAVPSSTEDGSTGDAADQALAFLELHRSAFGVKSDRVRFAVRSARESGELSSVRVDQLYAGVPVFGAQAAIQAGRLGVGAASLDLLRETSQLDLAASPTTATLTAEEALAIARHELAAEIPGVELGVREAPRLVVFAPEVLDLEGAPKLSWQVAVAAPSGLPAERFLVDARDGSVLLRHALAYRALDRQVFDAQNSSNIPMDPARAEGDPATGETEVDEAYDYSGDTYAFYSDHHGRDSLDDAGHPLTSVVRYCPGGNCAQDDAFWDGTRAFYTDGLVADDVVGHEFTHGVTQLTSDLIYLNQSGAINESLSDIWGEFIDLTNGAGNDSGPARWLIAEDASIGVLRDMSDPPAFGDPDSTCSELYFSGLGDSGGVHINSGILNKLAYLLVDGDTFNGYTITGMGIPLVADLFYEIQTQLLVPGSNFVDVYHAMDQAAVNLGLDPSERANVDDAMRAVEIDPDGNCHPPPPPPINDECAGALPITYGEMIGYTEEGTLSAAPSCAGGETTDVWYVFSAETTDTVTFSTCSYANFDTSLSIFDGCGGTRLACNDDDLSCGLESTVTLEVTAGNDYYLRVSGYGGQFGSFVLSAQSATSGGEACGGDLLPASSAGFETGLDGVATTGLWHRTNACRTQDPDHPSDYALYFGDDGTCDYATGQAEQGYATAPVDLTAAEGTVRLSYETILQWTGGGELVSLDASTDAGASWAPIASNTAPPFLFPTSSWECREFDLSSFAGDDLLLRFGFDTVTAIGSAADGFYVDNLLVEAEGLDGQGVEVPCETAGNEVHQAGFETGEDGYGLTGLWHRSDACAASLPSHHSSFGLYFGVDPTCTFNTGQAEAGSATSPPIDLSEWSGLLLLSLRYHLETDENLDLAQIEISDDGGNTWSMLASNLGVPTLGDGGGIWKCGVYNISAWVGRTVRLRASFDSQFAILNNFDGFVVDDFRVTSSNLPATIFTDGFESGDTTAWSSAVGERVASR